ncbi:MAG: hypothetical protein ACK5LK_01990 [Chthoniobacterales bacterium]
MRTTLDIPDMLFRELKSESAKRGLKLKELLAIFVEEGLRGIDKNLSKTKTRKRSPLPTVRRGNVPEIPARSNAELSRILDGEEA